MSPVTADVVTTGNDTGDILSVTAAVTETDHSSHVQSICSSDDAVDLASPVSVSCIIAA